MGKVVELPKTRENKLGFPHILCGDCENNTFHIYSDEVNGEWKFLFLICTKCGNEIPVNISPVFNPDGETLNNEKTE